MLLAERITLELILALVSRGPAHTAGDADIAAAEARIDAARSASHPRVGATVRGGVAPGSLIRIPGTDVFVNGQTPLDDASAQARYGAELTIEQRLYDFGRTGAAIDAARAARNATTLDAAASLARTRRAAADAFFTWARADAIASTATVEARAGADARTLIVRLVDEGKRPPADIDAPEAEYLRAELAAHRAVSDANATRHALEVFVGPLPADAHPALDLVSMGASSVRASSAGAASSSSSAGASSSLARAEAAAADAQVAAARAEVRARERVGRPAPGAAATLGLRGLDDRLLPGWDAGLTLSIPLHDASLAAATREARARARAAEARRAQLARQATAEARAATDELAAANDRVALAHRLVATAERAVRRAEELARMRDAPEQLARARAELRRARLERDLAVIDLAAATFRLGVASRR